VILSFFSITAGLIARFGTAKDNFGVAGFALGLVGLILMFVDL
jgi:hypothetical protein